jgi:hypothetical protein
MFGMGKRKLEERFTRSEMVLLAWRSQELSAEMSKQSQGTDTGKVKQTDASIPVGLPDHFYNEKGEVDMRNVTGEEAYRYMSSQGIRLPIMTGNRGAKR